MCGIAGIYDPNSGQNSDHPTIIDKLLTETRHRGPDSTGTKFMGSVSLGANRLSIVDIEGGSNPLTKDGVVVAFNGEIFNWKELRKELEGHGHTFSTDCDTEVIAAAWQQWGKEFPKRLVGMYAILLNDTNTDQFVVVTDPTEIKPLFYARAAQGRTIYCSEAYPLQHLSQIPGQVDKVHPGQIIVNGEATTHYDIRNPELLDKPPTPEEIRKILVESIAMSLPPKGEKFGIFLSGGLDSGAIASIAAQHLDRKDDMVVLISGREDSSDAQGGLNLAKELGLRDDQIHRVKLDPEEVFNDLPEIVKHFGQFDFFQISNGINFWYCSKAAHEIGLKVALCGDGSDEIFGGYFHYLESILKNNPEYFKNLPPSDDDLRHMQEYAMRAACLMRLHSERNMCVDSMSMAHSVEVRPPFLMPAIIQAGLSVPMENKVKIENGEVTQTKTILRDALRGFIPDSVVDSAKVPGYIGAQTLGRNGGNPFTPFTKADKGSVRERMREAGEEINQRCYHGDWVILKPEEEYLFRLWSENYGPMVHQANYYMTQQEKDPLGIVHYPSIVSPGQDWIPANAIIATPKGLAPAGEYFKGLNVINESPMDHVLGPGRPKFNPQGTQGAVSTSEYT